MIVLVGAKFDIKKRHYEMIWFDKNNPLEVVLTISSSTSKNILNVLQAMCYIPKIQNPLCLPYDDS